MHLGHMSKLAISIPFGESGQFVSFILTKWLFWQVPKLHRAVPPPESIHPKTETTHKRYLTVRCTLTQTKRQLQSGAQPALFHQSLHSQDGFVRIADDPGVLQHLIQLDSLLWRLHQELRCPKHHASAHRQSQPTRLIPKPRR